MIDLFESFFQIMKNLEISVGIHRVRKGSVQSTSEDIHCGVFDLPVRAKKDIPGRFVRCTAMKGDFWECVRITLRHRARISRLRVATKPQVEEIQRVRDLFFEKNELVLQFYDFRDEGDWKETHLVVLWHPVMNILPDLPSKGPNFTLIQTYHPPTLP